MQHYCDRHFELWPEYWRHVYVGCREDKTGRFVFEINAGDSMVVNFCPICGAESPAHIDQAIQQKQQEEKAEEELKYALSH